EGELDAGLVMCRDARVAPRGEMLVDERCVASDDRLAVLPGDRARLDVNALADPHVHARGDQTVEVAEAALEIRLKNDSHFREAGFQLEREPERRFGVRAVFHVEADEETAGGGARADLRAVAQRERRV